LEPTAQTNWIVSVRGVLIFPVQGDRFGLTIPNIVQDVVTSEAARSGCSLDVWTNMMGVNITM
jgi:hypothetical protein